MTSVYTLNETAAWLWERLGDEEFTVDTMVDLLMSHYDNAEQGRVMDDVKTLVDQLLEQGLIVA